MSYCVRPTGPTISRAKGIGTPGSTELNFLGNDWEEPSDFPLQLCQGDCDGDFDCEGDLVCHQRNTSAFVPSCAGIPVPGTDYCVHPSDEIAHPPEPESFRLKLYWEFGYDWQEVFWELEWCMQCPESECVLDGEVFLDTCDDDSTWFVFENLTNKQTQLRVAVTNLCLELDGPRRIRLRPCDAFNERQFFHSGNQRFTDDFFEIHTPTLPGCLTQEHHPRGGEFIYRQECERPRRDNTNFWQKY